MGPRSPRDAPPRPWGGSGTHLLRARWRARGDPDRPGQAEAVSRPWTPPEPRARSARHAPVRALGSRRLVAAVVGPAEPRALDRDRADRRSLRGAPAGQVRSIPGLTLRLDHNLPRDRHARLGRKPGHRLTVASWGSEESADR